MSSELKKSLFYLYILIIIVLGNACSHNSILYKNEVSHNFSNPKTLDQFQLTIKGKSLLDSETIFTIKNADGITLFSETFPSTDLIGYGLLYDTTRKQQEDYILKRAKNFFNEDKFFARAINSKDEFDADYSDLEIWNDIKSDSTAIGFSFLIGEENMRFIAFSKKLKKIVVYFCCC